MKHRILAPGLAAVAVALSACGEGGTELTEERCASLLGLVQAGGSNDSIPFWSAERLVCPLEDDRLTIARVIDQPRCLAVLTEAEPPRVYLTPPGEPAPDGAYAVRYQGEELRADFALETVVLRGEAGERPLECRHRPQRDVLWLGGE